MQASAAKLKDGSVEATCRLDNTDWLEGRKALLSVASAWPAMNTPLQSSRHFALLVPKKGDPQKIIVPTFLSRLFGRT